MPLVILDEDLEEGYNSFCEKSVVVEGLLWVGVWEEKSIGLPKADLSSTRLERPRWSKFPSWTWLGWKSTSHFAEWKCTIGAVYEDPQMDLAWEEDAEQILENSAAGLNPKFLDIKGTFFDVSLAWDPENSVWAYTEPPAFKWRKMWIPQCYMPPNTLEKGEGRVHKFVALLLSNIV